MLPMDRCHNGPGFLTLARVFGVKNDARTQGGFKNGPRNLSQDYF